MSTVESQELAIIDIWTVAPGRQEEMPHGPPRDDEFLEQMRALEALGTSDGDAYERTAVIGPPRDHGPIRISYGAF